MSLVDCSNLNNKVAAFCACRKVDEGIVLQSLDCLRYLVVLSQFIYAHKARSCWSDGTFENWWLPLTNELSMAIWEEKDFEKGRPVKNSLLLHSFTEHIFIWGWWWLESFLDFSMTEKSPLGSVFQIETFGTFKYSGFTIHVFGLRIGSGCTGHQALHCHNPFIS